MYVHSRNGERNIFETSHELHDILRRQKQTVFFREYAVWQGAIGDGLLALFGSWGLSSRYHACRQGRA